MMKLSEAIRLGAMMSPPAVMHMKHPQTGGTCALGAACEAMGIAIAPEANTCQPQYIEFLTAVQEMAKALKEAFPILTRKPELAGLIAQRNDFNQHTRERIADWVETIERAEEAKKAQVERGAENAVGV